jgi:hypothetical protein
MHCRRKRSCSLRKNVGGPLIDKFVVRYAQQIGKPGICARKPFITIDKSKTDGGIVIEGIEFELRVRHCTVAVGAGKIEAERWVGLWRRSEGIEVCWRSLRFNRFWRETPPPQ